MRAAIVLQENTLYVLLQGDTHLFFSDTRVRRAFLRRVVINVACSTVEPKKLLQLRHRPPVRARGTMNSNRHALRAALSRQSLANPCVLESRLTFCHAGPEMSMARSSADDWPARLF